MAARIQLLPEEPQIQILVKALKVFSDLPDVDGTDEGLLADELRLEILKKRREQMF